MTKILRAKVDALAPKVMKDVDSCDKLRGAAKQA